jgi:hypothetical protein
MRDWIAELLERSGSADRAAQLPAWALLFHSPFARCDDATSWIGGAPRAPGDFEWPNDTDGTPLHFMAQIDLASLKPEPRTGSRPPGLPAEGALLVFIGKSYACRILSAARMAEATIFPPSEDLAPISKHGFFGEGRTFVRRTVIPTAYLDTSDDRPAFLPDRFKSPFDWIVNWGIAALEAQTVIDSLNSDLNSARSTTALREMQHRLEAQAGKPLTPFTKTPHDRLIERRAADVVAPLKVWRDFALSMPQDDTVDRDSLDAIMRVRLDLHDEMGPQMSKFVLAGRADAVWDVIRRQHPRLDHGEGYDELPVCYRPFIDMRESGWRRHCLFGLEPEFPNNGEDLRGQDCFISIAADALLETDSEHEYGFSIWCPRDRMMEGLFDEGQLIRHCAV